MSASPGQAIRLTKLLAELVALQSDKNQSGAFIILAGLSAHLRPALELGWGVYGAPTFP